MKVLWMIDGREMYGEKRAICSLMQGVRVSGWAVEAVSLMEGECTEALQSQGQSVTSLQIGVSPGMQLARSKAGKIWQAARLGAHQLRIRTKIRRAIRQRRPDVVHVLSQNILPAVGWAAAHEGKPCFWEMANALGRGYPFDLNCRLYRALCRRLNVRPLANSRYTAATLADKKFPVEVMYLGVDKERFDPRHVGTVTRESLGIPPGAIVFAIVARVDPTKGQRLFLEAMLLAGDERNHLLLVGASARSAEVIRIQQIVRSFKAEGRVHMVDLTAEPEAYIALSDIVVNARVDAEPFGLSTVEGMMMGKPALVHALGGPAETVLDGETGWHVPEPTPAAFHAGICRVIADRSRWPQMGAAARRRAEEMFSLEAQTRRYRSLVSAALREQHS